MISRHTDSWFAIRVKSNRERVTADALRGKGFEVCLPAYREHRLGSRGRQAAEVPLFAGYLFSCFDIHNRLPILTVPGIVHIVGFGKAPQPVDANEMASVFALIQSGLRVTPHPYLPVGHRVQLRTGPLRGVEGIVLAHKGEDRFVVSLTLLQRSIAVDVHRRWIAEAAAPVVVNA